MGIYYNKMVKILGIQTGDLRAKAAKNVGYEKRVTRVDNGNGELQRIFLSQHLEEKGEMKDFENTLGSWLEGKNYNVFLSIGSTSTQGWYKKDGEYHPLQLASDAAFMNLGSSGNKTGSIIEKLDETLKALEIYEIHILCFNSIGYKVGVEELILTGSDSFDSPHLMLEQLNETVKKIERVKSVTVWPRKKTVDVHGKSEKVGGSWLLNLIKDPDYRQEVIGKESFDYDYIMDMGGSSATLYDLKGKEIGKISSKEKNSMKRYSKEEWAKVGVDSPEDKDLLKDCLNHALKLLGINRAEEVEEEVEKEVAKEVAAEEINRLGFTRSGGKKKRTRKHKKSHKKSHKKTHKKTHKKSHKKSHKTHKKRHSKKNARKSRKHKSRK